jgi:hypothetical protein
VLRLSPACVAPEIVFERPGETLEQGEGAGLTAAMGVSPWAAIEVPR